jgi:hypothetical protein
MDSKNCARCLLSMDVPGVEIGSDGLCSVCKDYDRYMLDWNKQASLESLQRALWRAKKKNALYDVLIPLSGGKDSTYILYQCREIFHLRCLAITWDNGFLSDHAKKNIANACKILGVDHFYFGLNRDYMMRVYRHFFLNTGFFCPVCLAGMGITIQRVQEAFRIPLSIVGTSKATEEYVNPAYFVEGDIDFMENVLKKNPFEGPVNYFLRQAGLFRSPQMIKLPEYLRWDYNEIFTIIKTELGWTAREEDAEHSDCVVDNIVHYIRYRKYPVLIPEMLRFSKLATCGQMTRSEALRRVNQRREDLTCPENMGYFLASLNIGKQEFEDTLHYPTMHLPYLRKKSRIKRRLGHLKEMFLG